MLNRICYSSLLYNLFDLHVLNQDHQKQNMWVLNVEMRFFYGFLKYLGHPHVSQVIIPIFLNITMHLLVVDKRPVLLIPLSYLFNLVSISNSFNCTKKTCFLRKGEIGFDGKMLRKAMARKTVDHNPSIIRYLEVNIFFLSFVILSTFI